MATHPSAEQKAAAASAAAEAQNAENSSEQGEGNATADQGSEAAETRPKTPGLVVVGAAAVLPLVSGGERYVYRGAPVGDEFTKEGVKHAQSVGLVSKPKK